MSFLYIGEDPIPAIKKGKENKFLPAFSSNTFFPIAWYMLFDVSDAKKRREAFPRKKHKEKSVELDEYTEWKQEPILFSTTVSKAKENLKLYRDIFKNIPYLWSYFRIIDIIDEQIDQLVKVEEEVDVEALWQVHEPPKQRNKRLSQVKVEEDPNILDKTNPFSELETLGSQGIPKQEDDVLNEFGISEDELLAAFDDLKEIETLDLFDQETTSEEEEEESQSKEPAVVALFEQLVESTDIKGKKILQVMLFFEKLLHHVKREGQMTRVMVEILGDIFRESNVEWRLTGQLSEDMLRGEITNLGTMLLGNPSPYIVLNETFDLEFWTNGTLQEGDERLMFSLSMLPSEAIHQALRTKQITKIRSSIVLLLSNTIQKIKERLLVSDLLIAPKESSLWGIRMIIVDKNRNFTPVTLLNPKPELTWKEYFMEILELPSVRHDWHVNLELISQDFTIKDEYFLEFSGARTTEEAFKAFGRWLRRSQQVYYKKFGVEGTIQKMAEEMLNSDDLEFVLEIFDILNQLTEHGFNKAVEVLSNDLVIKKITNVV